MMKLNFVVLHHASLNYGRSVRYYFLYRKKFCLNLEKNATKLTENWKANFVELLLFST